MRNPILAILTFTLTVCTAPLPAASAKKAPVWPRLAGVEAMKVPADNPLTREKVELGRALFDDPRLSADGSTACTGCHDPGHGYTIGAARPVAAFKQQQNRACPSLINVGYQKAFFWEGSGKTLEKAVKGVWQFLLVTPGEGRPKLEDVVAKLNQDPALKKNFVAAFGHPATTDDVVNSLASYLRTLVPANAPWVRYWNGETAALSEKARKGFEIFDGKARCSMCHSTVLLTDRLYHNIGAGKATGDVQGRGGLDPRDMGAFKTPTLLNIARSAPYFHDNSVPALEQAVDTMLSGGFPAENKDPQLRAVTLTAEERELLLAFLAELNADPASIH